MEKLNLTIHNDVSVNFKTMTGKTVKYKDKIYQVAQWIHYRLEWFEVELKEHKEKKKNWIKESDVIVL